MNAKDIARFWSKVDKEKSIVFYNNTRCWEWTAGKIKKGYGAFGVGLRVIYAHRLAWELVHGEIPNGLHVLHHCDNKICCNDAHLFLGTNQDNVDDKVKKGRQLRGENITQSKLTAVQVAQIRECYAAGGITQVRLAREFGVSHATISDIVNFKLWR